MHGRPEDDLHAGLRQRPRRLLAVQLAERDLRPADVAPIGRVQEAGAEHHGRQRKRRLVSRDVERRQRDEVPQRGDRVATLAVGHQPRTERDVVEGGVVEVEPPQRQRRPGQPGPVAEREVAVAGQRTEQLQRGRERRAADDRRDPTRREHRDLEAWLEVHHVGGSQPLEERPVRGAAPQEDVLAVVEPAAPAAERPREPAQLPPALEQGHSRAAVGGPERGRDPGQASAHHDDIGPAHDDIPARARAATKAFSRPDSDTRPAVTANGSASIRSSRRR